MDEHPNLGIRELQFPWIITQSSIKPLVDMNNSMLHRASLGEVMAYRVSNQRLHQLK